MNFNNEDFKLDFWGYNKSSFLFGNEPSVPFIFIIFYYYLNFLIDPLTLHSTQTNNFA
jgi:hypothetical protein